MEGEECGRGKRVKRVIVCRNGWHNCCLPAFQKGGGGGCRATSTKSSSSPPKPKAGSSNKATVAEDTIPLMPVAAADTKGSQTGSPIQPQTETETETSTEAETSTTVVALRTSSSSEPSEEEEDEKDKYDTKLCEECGRGDGEQEMLLCDGCDRGFHMFCLCPILVTVPSGDWFCPHCSHSARVQGMCVQHCPFVRQCGYFVFPLGLVWGLCCLHFTMWTTSLCVCMGLRDLYVCFYLWFFSTWEMCLLCCQLTYYRFFVPLYVAWRVLDVVKEQSDGQSDGQCHR